MYSCFNIAALLIPGIVYLNIYIWLDATCHVWAASVVSCSMITHVSFYILPKKVVQCVCILVRGNWISYNNWIFFEFWMAEEDIDVSIWVSCTTRWSQQIKLAERKCPSRDIRELLNWLFLGESDGLKCCLFCVQLFHSAITLFVWVFWIHLESMIA